MRGWDGVDDSSWPKTGKGGLRKGGHTKRVSNLYVLYSTRMSHSHWRNLCEGIVLKKGERSAV